VERAWPDKRFLWLDTEESSGEVFWIDTRACSGEVVAGSPTRTRAKN
jgi:hypothetical protein